MELKVFLIFSLSLCVFNTEGISYPNKEDFVNIVLLQDLGLCLEKNIITQDIQKCYAGVENNYKKLTDDFLKLTETAIKNVNAKFFTVYNPNYHNKVNAPLVELQKIGKKVKEYQEFLNAGINQKSNNQKYMQKIKFDIGSYYKTFLEFMNFYNSKKDKKEEKVKEFIEDIFEKFVNKLKVIAENLKICMKNHPNKV